MSDCVANEVTSPKTLAIRVSTGSRLHFGLIDTVSPFGGVGVMIDSPATEIVVTKSNGSVCEGDDALRIRQIVQRVADYAQLDELPDCHVQVVQRAPAHSGLGSGTQLAMAVAEATSHYLGLSFETPALASELAARGKRSAVGVHGYFAGGLIFEQSDNDDELNHVRSRIAMPSHWCVAVVRPSEDVAHISGQLEQQQFAALKRAKPEQRRELCELIEARLLPAAERGQFGAFTDAVQAYNRASGMLFTAVQGGPYNGHQITSLIDELVEHGARGVGQSSWGPGVFAWFESLAEATQFVDQLPPSVEPVAVGKPKNSARMMETDGT